MKAWLALWLCLGFATAPAAAPWRIAAIELPPAFGSHTPQGGYYAVLLRRLLQELEVEPEFVFLPPQRAYQAALDGAVDAALPFKRTPEREKHLLFTEPFFVASVRIFVRKADDWQPHDAADLRRQRGCTLLGAQSPEALQAEVDAGEVVMERVPGLEACFRLLRAHRVRFVVAGVNSGWLAAQAMDDQGAGVRMAPFVLAEEPVQLALPRSRAESPQRVQRLNAALRKLRTQLRQLEAQIVPTPPGGK